MQRSLQHIANERNASRTGTRAQSTAPALPPIGDPAYPPVAGAPIPAERRTTPASQSPETVATTSPSEVPAPELPTIAHADSAGASMQPEHDHVNPAATPTAGADASTGHADAAPQSEGQPPQRSGDAAPKRQLSEKERRQRAKIRAKRRKERERQDSKAARKSGGRTASTPTPRTAPSPDADVQEKHGFSLKRLLGRTTVEPTVAAETPVIESGSSILTDAKPEWPETTEISKPAHPVSTTATSEESQAEATPSDSPAEVAAGAMLDEPVAAPIETLPPTPQAQPLHQVPAIEPTPRAQPLHPVPAVEPAALAPVLPAWQSVSSEPEAAPEPPVVLQPVNHKIPSAPPSAASTFTPDTLKSAPSAPLTDVNPPRAAQQPRVKRTTEPRRQREGSGPARSESPRPAPRERAEAREPVAASYNSDARTREREVRARIADKRRELEDLFANLGDR